MKISVELQQTQAQAKQVEPCKQTAPLSGGLGVNLSSTNTGPIRNDDHDISEQWPKVKSLSSLSLNTGLALSHLTSLRSRFHLDRLDGMCQSPAIIN